MIPRTIAEPIFPAPIIPIFSFNIAVPPSPSIKARSQNKELKPELQSHPTPKTKGLRHTTEGPLRQLLLKKFYRSSVSFAQGLKTVQCLVVVGAQGQDLAIFLFRVLHFAHLGVGLAQGTTPIVSPPSHS